MQLWELRAVSQSLSADRTQGSCKSEAAATAHSPFVCGKEARERERHGEEEGSFKRGFNERCSDASLGCSLAGIVRYCDDGGRRCVWLVSRRRMQRVGGVGIERWLILTQLKSRMRASSCGRGQGTGGECFLTDRCPSIGSDGTF